MLIIVLFINIDQLFKSCNLTFLYQVGIYSMDYIIISRKHNSIANTSYIFLKIHEKRSAALIV